jgi:tRNA threonylcarbamoyladenosine biosynthesis protein TsaE
VLFNSTSTAQLPAIASEILSYAANARIFLFYGELGAGKTTLIKSLCECLGTTEPVTSPTFSIVNEYIGENSKIYHFDFYRLKNQNEALDLGYEEYFYSGVYCFIEWPEKISGLLPEHYVKVEINVSDNDSRQIIIGKI